MGRPIKIIQIMESVSELKKLHRHSSDHIKPRLQLLLLIKTGKAFSRLQLASALGVDPNSAQSWKKSYELGGLKKLLSDRRGGRKKGAITASVHDQLSHRLNDPKEGFRSFIEIQQWLQQEFGIEMGYHAVNKYVKRKFGARLKVSRKSHVLRSPAAEAVFKNPVRKIQTYKDKIQRNRLQ